MGFNWDALGAPSLRGLAKAAGLDRSDPATALRRKFGSTPGPELIDQLWPALRDEWLQRDRKSATALAERLKARGAGKADAPIRNHDQRMAYLRGCRISKAVREEALAVLIELAGQQSRPAHVPASQKSPEKHLARAPRNTTSDQSAVEIATRLIEATRPGLAAMTAEHVPGVVTALQAFIDGNSQGKKKPQELVPEMFLATLHVLAEHQTIVPKGLDRAAVSKMAMPTAVARAASTVAKGARSWAKVGPNDLGFLVSQHFMKMVTETGSVDVGKSLLMLLHFLTTGGDPKVMSDFAALDALVKWSLALMDGPRVGRADTHAAPIARKAPAKLESLHPIVAEALSATGKDERIHAITNGGTWFASHVGGTAVWSTAPLRSRDHTVTPVHVDTVFAPRRVPPARQLAAALSHANIHNGVNSVAWLDGQVHIRSAAAAHDGVNGWLGPYLGVAMMSSAMFALHAAPELRGGEVAGPDGVRTQPSWYVAKLEGWEVSTADAEKHRLPSRDLLAATAKTLLSDVGEVKLTKHTVECRLPGPNGKIEGWLGRRGGKSDDQHLTISAVTRPPWGAGVKFVLMIPNRGSKAANEDLAMRWNVTEWEQVPSVNIWGGWSGEEGALRLTSFVPQMLFRPSEKSNAAAIGNFIVYAIGRGNLASVSLSLA